MYDISQTDIVAKQRKQVVSNAKSNQPHVEEQKNVVVNPSYQSSNLNKSLQEEVAEYANNVAKIHPIAPLANTCTELRWPPFLNSCSTVFLIAERKSVSFDEEMKNVKSTAAPR